VAALIEDAKARAAEIVRKQLGRGSPELADKIAKYIVAFMLAERLRAIKMTWKVRPTDTE